MVFSLILKGQSTDLKFQKLTARDGLSNSSIYSILQDNQGFLWIGTYDGLNQYDGYSIKIHDFINNESTAALSRNFSSIDKDNRGNLWFGVKFGGIYCYNILKGVFTNYLIDSSKQVANPKNNVWVVKVDKTNRIWMGMGTEGLLFFDQNLKNFTTVELSPTHEKYSVTSIIEDTSGFIWVSTAENGIFIINPENLTVNPFQLSSKNGNSIDIKRVNALFQDSKHQIWIGTKDNGFLILQPGTETFQHFKDRVCDYPLISNNIRCFMEDFKGNIWIGSDGDGLFIYNPTDQNYANYRNEANNNESLSSNVIFTIYQTRDGVVWVGTNMGAINIYDAKREKFSAKGSPDELLHNILTYKVVLSVLEDKNQNIWFGTDGAGINFLSANDKTCTIYMNDPENPHSLSGNATKILFNDSKNQIWIGTYGHGLNLYRPKPNDFQRITTKNGNIARDIWDIDEDNSGNLWIATLNDGLFYLPNGNTEMLKFDEIIGQPVIGEHLFCLLWDKQQNGLWLGTNNGLRFLHPTNQQVTSWVHQPNDSLSLSGFEVKVIYKDAGNNLWVGTQQGGLNQFLPEKNGFKIYNTQNGFISNTIASIQEDSLQRLWISTSRGMILLNPRNSEIINFTADDGLKNTEYLNKSVCKLHSGNFIFGGTNGYDVIDPSSMEFNSFPSEVYITKMVINNQEVTPFTSKSPLKKSISAEDEITLHHNQKTVTFYLSAINFTHPERNQYAYWMEGMDTAWYKIGNQRMITFTNLKPKTYSFWYNASNNDGIWNNNPKKLIIHVLPPWWMTWWARILAIGFIILIIISWYRYRLKTIKQQKSALEILVKQRTHELIEEKEKVESQNIELTIQKNEILKQNDEIKTMSERLHQADEEKLEFFTIIAHEIRTPLTLILGPLEQALSNIPKNDSLQKQLQRVYRNAEILRRLVTQILDFRKTESPNYQLQATNEDIIKIINDISVSFFDWSKNQQIEYRVVTEIKQLSIWIDTDKFFKIMVNLLSNAFKFTPKGGQIAIHISQQPSDSNFPDGSVVIKVVDTGSGMPKEQLEKIFTPFYQAHSPLNSQHHYAGTGLGLALVKRLTEIHYGTIQVESAQNQGTQITVTLPLGNQHLEPDEMVLHTHSQPDAIIDSSPFTGINKNEPDKKEKQPLPELLLVEDNADLRNYLTESLSGDYHITEAVNGKEGFSLAVSMVPSIIISDIMMHEMDGMELCKKLKNHINTSHIPIILLTAVSETEAKIKGLESGADDYITKPFNYRELTLKIRNIIATRTKLRLKFTNELILKPTELTLTSTDEKFLKKLIEILEQNISDSEFQIETLSKELGVSRSLLYVKIKEYTNLSVYDFIKSFRLKRAAQLLQQQKARISEIADMVGFSDPTHFGKSFKKEFGITPGEYAEKYKPSDTKQN